MRQLLLTDSNDPSDSALPPVSTVQRGDDAAIGELYDAYHSRVRGYLGLALCDSHAADDAAQEVFVRARARLASLELEPIENMRKWLFGIAHYVALDELRRRTGTEPWDPAEIASHHDEVAHAPDPHAQLTAGKWALDELLPQFQDLPAAQREALGLVVLAGCPYEEAAELMGQSKDNVRQLKSRAIKALNGRASAAPIPSGRGRRHRSAMWVRLKPLPVIAQRRWVLARGDARTAFTR